MAPGWRKNVCGGLDMKGAGLWERGLGCREPEEERREPEEERRVESAVRQVWGVMKTPWASWTMIWPIFSKSLALWRTGAWGKVVREWLPYCLNVNAYFLAIRLFPNKFRWMLCWHQAHARPDLRWSTAPFGPPVQQWTEVAGADIFSWFKLLGESFHY